MPTSGPCRATARMVASTNSSRRASRCARQRSRRASPRAAAAPPRVVAARPASPRGVSPRPPPSDGPLTERPMLRMLPEVTVTGSNTYGGPVNVQLEGQRLRTADGTTLRVVESGERDAEITVVLVHGWTLDHTSWARV